MLLITNHTELDEQIEKVLKEVDEDFDRTRNGADLVRVLNSSELWLVCSRNRKFGSGEDLSEWDVDAYVEGIKKNRPKRFYLKEEFFVFVDECHCTHLGTLHEAIKALLPVAMLIDFTGTLLLKSDKRRSIETVGLYIHTSKYDETVKDGVVLDLRYEARDIDRASRPRSKWMSGLKQRPAGCRT